MLADNPLTHGADGEDSVTDGFAVIVTDSDGSSVNASLDVRIIDDVPAARDDVDSVTDDGAATAAGNVLTGLGGGDANATDGVADTQCAAGESRSEEHKTEIPSLLRISSAVFRVTKKK